MSNIMEQMAEYGIREMFLSLPRIKGKYNEPSVKKMLNEFYKKYPESFKHQLALTCALCEAEEKVYHDENNIEMEQSYKLTGKYLRTLEINLEAKETKNSSFFNKINKKIKEVF